MVLDTGLNHGESLESPEAVTDGGLQRCPSVGEALEVVFFARVVLRSRLVEIGVYMPMSIPSYTGMRVCVLRSSLCVLGGSTYKVSLQCAGPSCKCADDSRSGGVSRGYLLRTGSWRCCIKLVLPPISVVQLCRTCREAVRGVSSFAHLEGLDVTGGPHIVLRVAFHKT